MTVQKSKRSAHHLRASDLRAAALLATQATHAVTSMAEGVHQSIWRTVGAPGGASPDQARGLTGLIYQSIYGVSRLVSQGLTAALTKLEPWLQQLQGQAEESPERAAFVAALNGVMGDRLHASANPLATPMTLRLGGQVLDWHAQQPAPQVTDKVLIIIHGLCMNDLQWTVQQQGQRFNHAEVLASEQGYTPVYLRYNSGLHVSQNAQTLSALLDDLLAHWPQPVTELSVLAHSMGGLLVRSAIHAAHAACQRWPEQLRNIVFLGTPHHGAPLERAGNWVDVVLGSTPYTRPFARLGQLRSAGVTDLRYGYLVDTDWQGVDRFHRRPENHQHVPLPAGVRCFAVAASLGAQRGLLSDRLLGDGLVPLRSALGQHRQAQRCLQFAPEDQFIAYRTGHLQLLGSSAVSQQLLHWLS